LQESTKQYSLQNIFTIFNNDEKISIINSAHFGRASSKEVSRLIRSPAPPSSSCPLDLQNIYIYRANRCHA